MKLKDDAFVGYGLTALAGVFWGTTGIFGSILMDAGVPSNLVGVFRMGIGAFFIGCLMLYMDKSLFKVGWKGIIHIGLPGLATQSIINFTYFKAISLTTPSTAVVLLYTSPIFLLVFGMLFYNEKVTARKVLAASLCLMGCYLTATEGNISNLALDGVGILYGLGAGLSYAIITVVSKELLKHYNTVTILFYSFISGSIGLFAIAMPVDFGAINWSIKTVLAMGGLGLMPGALAYICYVSGLARGVEASKAGILSSLEVVTGVILAFLILGESMSIYKILGVAAVFGSILLVNKVKPASDKSGAKTGAILLVLSSLGFGLLPIFALSAYKANISVTTLLFIRFSLASVLFFIYVFIKSKRINLNKRDLLSLFVLGGICYNLQSRFYFSSIKYIPSSLAALFLYTYPMIVTAITFFVDKEKITKKMGVSIGISFAGLIMILGTSIGKINGFGILLALGAAFVYSIYIVLGNRMLKRTPPNVTSAFIALFSAIGVLVLGLFTHDISFTFETAAWLPIIGIVLFSTVIAMLFFFHGMELLGPAKASIISMMAPVFTVILSTMLLHDHLTILQLIGGAVVLAGAMLVIWSREQHSKEGEMAC